MSDTPAEYRAWVDKAKEDLLCIRNELAAAEKPWSVICFHAEQAAEKYLKAFLVANGVRPERTHDLGRLLSECAKFDPSLQGLAQDCEKLTEFAVDIRYPDIPLEAEEETGREAVKLAGQICEAVRARLPN